MTLALTLRPATASDAQLLFEWVNAPDCLSQKERTRGPISWNDHCAWLNARLADPSTQIYVLQVDGKAVGQVRLEAAQGEYFIDIYVVPAARKRGVAKQAVADVLRIAKPPSVVARVKAGNAASQRLFANAGFTAHGRDGEMIVYRRRVSTHV